MIYVLIGKTSKVMVFSVKACAELYRDITGGTLVSTIDNTENVKRSVVEEGEVTNEKYE